MRAWVPFFMIIQSIIIVFSRYNVNHPWLFTKNHFYSPRIIRIHPTPYQTQRPTFFVVSKFGRTPEKILVIYRSRINHNGPERKKKQAGAYRKKVVRKVCLIVKAGQDHELFPLRQRAMHAPRHFSLSRIVGDCSLTHRLYKIEWIRSIECHCAIYFCLDAAVDPVRRWGFVIFSQCGGFFGQTVPRDFVWSGVQLVILFLIYQLRESRRSTVFAGVPCNGLFSDIKLFYRRAFGCRLIYRPSLLKVVFFKFASDIRCFLSVEFWIRCRWLLLELPWSI